MQFFLLFLFQLLLHLTHWLPVVATESPEKSIFSYSPTPVNKSSQLAKIESALCSCPVFGDGSSSLQSGNSLLFHCWLGLESFSMFFLVHSGFPSTGEQLAFGKPADSLWNWGRCPGRLWSKDMEIKGDHSCLWLDWWLPKERETLIWPVSQMDLHNSHWLELKLYACIWKQNVALKYTRMTQAGNPWRYQTFTFLFHSEVEIPDKCLFK